MAKRDKRKMVFYCLNQAAVKAVDKAIKEKLVEKANELSLIPVGDLDMPYSDLSFERINKAWKAAMPKLNGCSNLMGNHVGHVMIFGTGGESKGFKPSQIEKFFIIQFRKWHRIFRNIRSRKNQKMVKDDLLKR